MKKKIQKVIVMSLIIIQLLSNNGLVGALELESSKVQDDTISRFELLPNKEEKFDFFTGETSYASICFAVNKFDEGLNGSKIVITVPKTDFITRQDITITDIVNQSSKTLMETEDLFIITYVFDSVNAGYSVEIPISVATNWASTPNGFVLPITAKLIANDNSVIMPEQSVLYTYHVKNFYVNKQIMTNEESWSFNDNLTVLAGKTDDNNPGNLETDLSEMIPISFSYAIKGENDRIIGNRFLETYVFEDILPEGAVFIPDINKGWAYDKASRKATYIVKKAWRTQDIDFKETVVLKLMFPGAALGDSHTFTNNVKVTATPKNRGEGEQDIIMEDAIDFHLEGTVERIQPIASKLADSLDFIDTKYSKSNEKGTFLLRFDNPYFDRRLTNLSINDNGLDDNFEITEFRIVKRSRSRFDGTVTLEVEYYDGSKEIIADKIRLNVPIASNSNYAFVKETNNVKSFILKTDNGYISAREYFQIEIDVMFRNPEQVNTNGVNKVSFGNSAIFETNYETEANGSLAHYSSIQKDTVDLLPSEQTTTRIQKRSSNQIITNDSTIEFYLQLFASNVYEEQSIEYNKVVDLLPIGMEYIANSARIVNKVDNTNLKWDSKLEPQPEIIENFNGTGKTALIWDLSTLKALKDVRGDYSILDIYYSVRPTVYLKTGANTNLVYLSWNNINDVKSESDRELMDIYDFNDNGSVTDHITGISTTVNYIPPKELIAFKEAKGNLNDDYLAPPNSAWGELNSEGSYNIRILNHSDSTYKNAYILDVLPHPGDKFISSGHSSYRMHRNSEFNIYLSGAIEVPKGWDVFYVEDDYGDEFDDMKDFYDDAKWVTDVSDYSKVTAFKLEMNDSVLEKDQEINIEVPIILPNEGDMIDKYSYNSYGITFNVDTPFFESNLMGFTTKQYSASGHIFIDSNESGLFDKQDTPLVKHLVKLVDDNGQEVVGFDGAPIQTVTNDQGFYHLDIFSSGSYRVKVESPNHGFSILPNYESALGSHVDDSHYSNTFTVNPNNMKSIKNAGFSMISPATESIIINKVFTGQKPSGVPFEFDLYDEKGDLLQTKSISETGKVEFDAIEYFELGHYQYTIRERIGDDVSIVYDDKTINVRVTVTENEKKELVANSEYSDNTFVNTYIEPVTTTIEIIKELRGRVIKEDEFEFTLSREEGSLVASGKNDKNGIVSLPMTFKQAGTYTYLLEETEGLDASIKYDKSIYSINSLVTLDSETNKLLVEVTYFDDKGNKLENIENIVFTNTYTQQEQELSQGEKSETILPSTGVSNVYIVDLMLLGLSAIMVNKSRSMRRK